MRVYTFFFIYNYVHVMEIVAFTCIYVHVYNFCEEFCVVTLSTRKFTAYHFKVPQVFCARVQYCFQFTGQIHVCSIVNNTGHMYFVQTSFLLVCNECTIYVLYSIVRCLM